MAGALRKTMLYLGLAEDERAEHVGDGYEGSEDYDAPEATMGHEQDAQVTPLHRNATQAFAQPHDLRRITTVHPRSYNDARVIGEAFRSGTPVIMNLSEMDDGDAKRLVDFSAGLIFGLHGTLERVTSKVFLLSPEHVEVTGEESTPQTRTGFFNQS